MLWIFCSCRLEFFGEIKTFEQVEQMTGVGFPLELGIVGSRLRVQERRILFKKYIKFVPKLILTKQKREMTSFSKTKFGSRPYQTQLRG